MHMNRRRTEAYQVIIASRRLVVAQLHAQGAQQSEIVQVLTKKGNLNPETLEPWDQATICRDIKALIAEWRKRAVDDLDRQRGRLLLELREHRRQAWADNNLSEVRLGILVEM